MGMLRITATIDLDQFWPGKDGAPHTNALISDADTVGIVVANDGIEFQRDPGGPFQVTRVFDRAEADDGKRRNRVLNNQRRMKIRLQGVDAPELHFRPTKPDGMSLSPAQYQEFLKWNFDYRQSLAETCTVKLRTELLREGPTLKTCVMTTQVDHPNDVFDKYGRGIGDLTVRVGAEGLQINRWLLRNGWALPSFYASMTAAEITELTALCQTARQQDAGIWPHVAGGLLGFDPGKRYRGTGALIDPAPDTGAFIVPKLFRRQAAWFALGKASAAPASFLSYLGGFQEYFQIASEFIAQGSAAATPHPIADIVATNGLFVYQPEETVYFESSSTLVDESGNPVINW